MPAQPSDPTEALAQAILASLTRGSSVPDVLTSSMVEETALLLLTFLPPGAALVTTESLSAALSDVDWRRFVKVHTFPDGSKMDDYEWDKYAAALIETVRHDGP